MAVGEGLPGSAIETHNLLVQFALAASAAARFALPAAAMDVKVREPAVGTTTLGSRLVEAAVVGASVRLTAVGEGAVICDPAEDPDVPPAERRWSGGYDYDITFRQRVAVR